jgi:opacity protein-like surface antigen
MATSRRIACVASVLFALVSGSAIAADLPVAPEVVPISPWYIRGDVGYKFYSDPNVSFNDPKAKVGSFSHESIDGTAVIGGGVGYRFSPWFRGDVTFDYEFPSEFEGRAPCKTCKGKTTYSKEYADVSAFTTLVNGYFDFGTWNSVTPYIGGGVGASNVEISNYHFKNPNGSRGKWKGDNEWNFAWAAMAGLSFAVTESVAIDVNYRYLSLGDGRTKNIPIGSGKNPVKFEDIAAHEFRVGFRYMFP